MAVLVVAVVALTAPDSTGSKSGSADSSPASQKSSQKSQASSAPSGSRSTTPTPTTSSRPPSSTANTSGAATGDPKTVPLVVLNNTTTNGLATQAADDFRNGGWTVTRVGNLQNNILSTCAYYDPAVSGAKAAAKALRSQFSGIKRTAAKFDALPSGPIVVVLTPDYSSN